MTTPLHAVVQGAERLACRSLPFRKELARSPLRSCLNRYLYVLMSQFAVGGLLALSSHRRPVSHAGCAMTQIAPVPDTFHVTHEFLAYMLGDAPKSRTAAAGALQRAGLCIEYRRGVDCAGSQGLEAAACSLLRDRSEFLRKVAALIGLGYAPNACGPATV